MDTDSDLLQLMYLAENTGTFIRNTLNMEYIESCCQPFFFLTSELNRSARHPTNKTEFSFM